MMAESVPDLRGLTDEELIGRHDELARNTVVGTQHYLDELNRREQKRQTEAMIGLTRSINVMTVVVTVAAVLGVSISAATLTLMIDVGSNTELSRWLTITGLGLDIVGFVGLIAIGPPPHWLKGATWMIPSEKLPPTLANILRWVAVALIVAGFSMQAFGAWIM